MTRIGRFADRDSWPAKGWCAIERAVDLVGTKSAMLVLREAYYGATRFEEFARRTGLSDAVVAGRLKQLVDDGLLARRPYRDPGARTREEYVLAERGILFYPVLVGLVEWSETVERTDRGVEYIHADCGKRVGVVVECEDHHRVNLAETQACLIRDAAGRS